MSSTTSITLILVFLSLSVGIAWHILYPYPAPPSTTPGYDYPPNLLTPFLGLHFFYNEPAQNVTYEVYLKAANTLDYHVWNGVVGGAQCSLDQYTDMAFIGDGMLRMAYEEPTGSAISTILDIGTAHPVLYRASILANWVVSKAAINSVSGCSTYDEQCLSKVLGWRNAGPLNPRIPVLADGGVPLLFLEKLAPGRSDVINCARTQPSPMVRLFKGLGAPLPVVVPEVAGFHYHYDYFDPIFDKRMNYTQSFEIYVKNTTHIDYIIQVNGPVAQPCVKNQKVTLLQLRNQLTRISWQGFNGSLVSNVFKPMLSFDHGLGFFPLANYAEIPADPHKFPHIYMENSAFATIPFEHFQAPGNETVYVCPKKPT